MCGISVWCDLRQKNQARNGFHGDDDERSHRIAAKLDCSAESMRHRGPDAKGVWVSSDYIAGLGHVRLSTRDLSSAGNQPLHSTDKTDDIHVVVNGELYYDSSVRIDLESEYTFQSTSDSEIVIPLYKRYGVDFVQHLRGEFSFALYDGKSQTLIAARDRFGVKPLYYGIFNSQLYIATQCKGIVKLLDEDILLQWDAQCLAQGGGPYGSRTFFRGISKLTPGHFLIVRRSSAQQLEVKPYYHSKYPANRGNTDNRPTEDLVKDLRSHLLEAVDLRLNSSDVPVGILLSGGIDSAAVAGMAAYLSRKRLAADSTAPPLPTCFTISFPNDKNLDETDLARKTAERLGLSIETVVVTEQVLVDEFDESCWLGELPVYDLQHMAKKALSRYISQRGFKVVLSGDGSDEFFGGYSFFIADRLSAADQLRAPSLRQASGSQRLHVQQRLTQNAGWFGRRGSKDQDENDAVSALGLSPAFCHLAVPRFDDWLVEEVRNLSDPYQAIHELFSPEEVASMATYHPLHRGMMAWEKTILPNGVMAALSDGAEMAHGVESRPPFLDPIVADFSHTLPVDMLVHLDSDKPPVEKWIFREAVKPYISEEVYTRPKKAFAAPFLGKVNGPLHRKLSSLITYENAKRLGFVDWEKCEGMVDRAFELQDELLFRQAIWLAQFISIGLQFNIQPWRSEDDTEQEC